MLLLLLALCVAPPACAAKHATIEQLSRQIASSHKEKDAKIAGRLDDLELTQRLSAAKLAALEAALPGPKSRRALVALADQAEFLDLPPAEILDQPAPTIEQQRAIVARSVDYVAAMLRRLPNLFARRDTIRYEDTPPGLQVRNTASSSGTFMSYQPLHPVSRSVATVLYRDGQEIVQAGAGQQGGSTSETAGLSTFGEFGPIFPAVYGDLPKGNLRWSHWEQGATSLEAVFRFDVPKAESHYLVRYCCIGGRVFQQFPAYHGELTIDPSNGTILRVTLIASLNKDDPVTQAELMVEYGPVELGGKKYFCPVRSISVSRAPVQATVRSAHLGRWAATPGGSLADAPQRTMLNETTFDHYHLFRADVQILTANGAEGGSKTNEPAHASSNPSASASSASTEQTTVANGNAAAEASAGSAARPAETSSMNAAKVTTPTPASSQLNASSTATFAAPAPSAASTVAKGKASNPAVGKSAAPPSEASQPAAESTASSAASSAPEMAVVAPGPFPRTPAPLPTSSGKSGFSLSVNARLVDVDVTAVDKKGRPVKGLTKKDFVIYDDGRKQALESFSNVSAAPGTRQATATAARAVLYSNLPDAVGSAHSASASAPESSTILLLDPTSLDFADLNHARQQILKFLDGLPESEPVGLYVRTGPGFRILAEETTDHAALGSALRKWAPTAKDLASAQEAERRNRQEFDTVDSTDALAGTNGEMIMPGSGVPVADPKRMQEGGIDPARETFGVLLGVAAHMDAIPGHKNLVWVASDNVLANWSDQAAGADISSDRIGSAGMLTQEALNDAHVSLYPLDASQLETAATDASLQNNSVQLSPAEQGNPLAAGAESEAREASMTDARATAEMLQDIHAVQPAIQQAAHATGGRAFPRASNMIGELDSVIADGDAAYLLSFAPDTPPDGKYHRITVAVHGRRGIRLRYRAGYLYTQEPSTLKGRFQQAVWQPQDDTGIALRARWTQASEGAAVSLQIAADDIGMKRQSHRWTDRLDIFLVQRDGTGTHATVKEETLVLSLKPGTYREVQHDGIPFAEYIAHQPDAGTVRIVVVDENSGRMGSITLPVTLEGASQ
ncbi:MAG: VWA domain-containing protein [Terracidiphilus sp.]